MNLLNQLRIRFLTTIRNNMGLKFIAFITSITIWLWVQTRQTAQERVRSKVNYVTAEKFVVLNQPTQLVTITVEAPKGLLRLLQDYPIQTQIDLRKQQAPGKLEPEFHTDDIRNIPEGVRVIQFSPPGFNVEIDELIEQTREIKVKTIGSPQRGWKIKNIVISPETVLVRGAKSILQNFEHISTTGVSVSNLSKTFRREIPLEKGHHTFEYVNTDAPTITIYFEEELTERQFDLVPIIPPEGWSVQPNTVSINLRGALLQLDMVKKEELSLQWTPPLESTEKTITNPSLSIYASDKKQEFSLQIEETYTFQRID